MVKFFRHDYAASRRYPTSQNNNFMLPFPRDHINKLSFKHQLLSIWNIIKQRHLDKDFKICVP